MVKLERPLKFLLYFLPLLSTSPEDGETRATIKIPLIFPALTFSKPKGWSNLGNHKNSSYIPCLHFEQAQGMVKLEQPLKFLLYSLPSLSTSPRHGRTRATIKIPLIFAAFTLKKPKGCSNSSNHKNSSYIPCLHFEQAQGMVKHEQPLKFLLYSLPSL